MISECDNIQLKAILLTQCLFSIVFKWNISYSSTSAELSNSVKQDGIAYFQTFSSFSSNTAISIPKRYYTSGCILDIVLTAETKGGLGTTSTSTQVKIIAKLPTVKFTSKTSDFISLSGSAPSIIPFTVANQLCNAPNLRLLDGSSIIPISLDFILYSGPTSSSITVRGDFEKKMEKVLSSLYQNYQTLNLNFSQGYQYYTYYNLTAIITDANTNTKTSDSILFSYFKQPITCIIDPIGSVVSITKDLNINGGNSIIPESDGDTIQHLWKCISSTSFSSGTTCSCPVLASYNLLNKQITIAESKMQNLCKYGFSLTVTATSSSGNKRTKTETIEFLALKSTISPVLGKIIDGYLQNVKDIYFTSELTNNGPDSVLTYEWSLIGVESLVPLSPEKYSQMNTFTYNFLKRIHIVGDDSKINEDLAIPDRYYTNVFDFKK